MMMFSLSPTGCDSDDSDTPLLGVDPAPGVIIMPSSCSACAEAVAVVVIADVVVIGGINRRELGIGIGLRLGSWKPAEGVFGATRWEMDG